MILSMVKDFQKVFKYVSSSAPKTNKLPIYFFTYKSQNGIVEKMILQLEIDLLKLTSLSNSWTPKVVK